LKLRWVFSSHLPAEEAQGHTVYTPSVGVEKLEDYSFNISYAEGTTVTGDVYRDTVNISGIVAHNQAIEAATSVPASFVSQTSRDGIIGLGFSSINSIQPRAQKTFFETVQEQLASPVFAAALKHNAPGSFDFGYIDDAKFKGDAIHYTPVNNSNGMWTINTTGYSVDGGATSPKPLPLRAIVDTGTSVMMLPDDVVREYYAPIPGSDNNQAMGGWVFDCSSDLPDFHLVLLDDDYTAVVPGSLINYSPLGGSGNLCYGSIQEQGSLDMSVLGDPFLKSQYAVFDAGGMRMGFAPQA
jgi:aspergillopepsin I